VTIVELPGYVGKAEGSLERALSSFGGEEAVTQTLATRGAMLPLRLRPGDPASHAIFGDPTLSTSFVLRIPRGPGGHHQAEIVAKAPVSYIFNGMSDFQFINLKVGLFDAAASPSFSIPRMHSPERKSSPP
jgi:hypothetical protein